MADSASSAFVKVDGLDNFRDIGGWDVFGPTGEKSGRVRKGVLYRGPDVTTITDAGLAKLRELDITILFDIRSTQQIDRAGGVRELEGIERRWCPVFAQEDYTPERAGLRYKQYAGDGTEGIVQAFSEILIHGAPVLKTILLYIAPSDAVITLSDATTATGLSAAAPMDTATVTGGDSTAPTAPAQGGSRAPPCLVHCTTGNNRTGSLIGALLLALGVKPSDIAAEYSLSNEGLANTRPKAVARLSKNPVFAAAYGDNVKARAERMLGARAESMVAMIEMVKARWGSAENYLTEVCGLTREEFERVKRVLIDDSVDGSD